MGKSSKTALVFGHLGGSWQAIWFQMIAVLCSCSLSGRQSQKTAKQNEYLDPLSACLRQMVDFEKARKHTHNFSAVRHAASSRTHTHTATRQQRCALGAPPPLPLPPLKSFEVRRERLRGRATEREHIFSGGQEKTHASDPQGGRGTLSDP